MGDEYGADRSLAQGVVDQIQCGSSRLRGNQWIDNDPAGFAPNNRHICIIAGPCLPDAIAYLKEAINVVQLRVTPERGVDAIWAGAILEIEPTNVPGRAAIWTFYTALWKRRKPAPFGVFKCLLVVQR